MAVTTIALSNTFDEWRIAFNDLVNTSNLQIDSAVLANLTTANKTTLVDAINEVHANQGDLSTLTTTDKSSLVNAVNEINSSISGFAELATANTFTQSQTISVASNFGALYLGSDLNAGDISMVSFFGQNSTNAQITYGEIKQSIIDNTATSEDGSISFSTVVAGALANRMNIGQGLYMDGATGGDMGIGTGNFSALYLNGVDISSSLGGNQVIIETFSDGVDYTSGTSNQITLTNTPSSPDQVMVIMDGVYQLSNTYTISGNVITFNTIIPSGVNNIEVRIGDGFNGTGSIGDGQSWQDKTTTRSLSTLYTNNTGRSIQVSINANGATMNLSLEVDGLIINSNGWAGATNGNATVNAIIPNGSVYRVTGTNVSTYNWYELS